jgi:hypothetical protein
MTNYDSNESGVTFVATDDSLGADVYRDGHVEPGDIAEAEQTNQYGEEDVPGSEEIDVDFDGSTEDDEVEDTGSESDAPANSAKKEAKPKKEPARGDLPDGYVTPVGLAHALNEAKLGKEDEEGNYQPIPPQVVYSYIKNAPKDYPFPIETIQDSLGKDRQVVKVEAGLEWWRAKNERAAARRANAAEKAKAAAEKAAKKASETPAAAAATEPAATEAE